MSAADTLSERLATMVVIHPGATTLRIGIADAQPVAIPHCVAYLGAHQATVTTPFTSMLAGGDSRERRRAAYNRLEQRLGVQQRPIIQREADQGAYQTAPATKTETTESNHLTKQHIFVGEEVLALSEDTLATCLVQWPMRQARLEVAAQVSPYSTAPSTRQVTDAIYEVWRWALERKLSLGPGKRANLCAVLVVPDTLSTWEIKEMVGVVLQQLGFSSVVVHQESIAALFNSGNNCACVVNVGSHNTTVCCVDEGVVLPDSRILLPYGSLHLAESLFWALQLFADWPYRECDPGGRLGDAQLLQSLLEQHLALGEEAQYEAQANFVVPAAGTTRSYVCNLGDVPRVVSWGFFHPSLFIAAIPSAVHPLDKEEPMDDFLYSKNVRGDAATPLPGDDSLVEPSYDWRTGESIGLDEAIVKSILSVGHHNRGELKRRLFSSIVLVGEGASLKGLVETVEERVLATIPADEEVQPRRAGEEPPSRVEQHAESWYTGALHLLVAVLACIRIYSADMVEVLPAKSEAVNCLWHGGALLGVIDPARDAWVQRTDWLGGGARASSRAASRKYTAAWSTASQIMTYLTPP